MTRHTGRKSPFRSEVLGTMSVVEGGPKRAELENFLGGLLNKAKARLRPSSRVPSIWPRRVSQRSARSSPWAGYSTS